MPFSTPLDLQQLLGLMWMMNMVFPRDRTSSCETFQTKDITLEEPEANPSFQDWEKSNYDLKLRMKFTFTHHVKPIIQEVDFDVDTTIDPDALAIEVYDPPPLREYVHLVEVELLNKREALSQALEDRAYVEKEARKWFLIGDYF
ncbi:hypothetical protein JHK87_012191 [Glycine soja]|nr:hypothetical protein JHK87_012191 [Glycine soja]